MRDCIYRENNKNLKVGGGEKVEPLKEFEGYQKKIHTSKIKIIEIKVYHRYFVILFGVLFDLIQSPTFLIYPSLSFISNKKNKNTANLLYFFINFSTES